MIPLRDNIASSRTTIINVLMIVLCGLAFFAQLSDGGPDGEPGLTAEYGMIPFRISHPGEPFEVPVGVRRVQTPTGIEERLITAPAGPSAVAPWLTMLTCIFLHGSWMHILGNMWFLWIFGDNVEDRLGHVGYLCFYLGCGIAASLAHYLTDPSSTLPTVGASGAIAGVMGAYFVWYPHSRVHALLPVFGFLQFVEVPAALFLGLWFLMQFLSGLGPMGAGGVAWWAHIGGFAAGVLVALLLGRSRQLATPRGYRPAPYRNRHFES